MCEQQALVKALDIITLGDAYAYNEEYCAFPAPDDPDPRLHFDGIAFGVSDEEVIITEIEFRQYVQQAGLFWIEVNKADADEIRRILLRVPR